jgi:hypothetical protein
MAAQLRPGANALPVPKNVISILFSSSRILLIIAVFDSSCQLQLN